MICLILMTVFAIACACSFIFTVSSDRTVAIEIAKPKVEVVIKENTSVDSVWNVVDLRLADQIDSLRQEVALLQRQHEHALDDLRQETNNIINKLNGWLGFWIAVAAILAVILPIVCQYFIVSRFEKEYEKDLDESKAHLAGMIEKYKDEIEHLRKEFAREKDQAIRNFEDKIQGSEIQSLLAQYRIGNDCELVNEGTSIFNAFQWNEVINGIQKTSSRVFDDSTTTLPITHRHELQKCLIQALGFIQEFNRHTMRRRKRGVVSTDLRTLFEQLENGDYRSVKDIRNRFDKLIMEMRKLISYNN